jgi:hypothetical protein
LLDPRYKNHKNIFDEFSQQRNKLALKLEAEKLYAPHSRHQSDNDSDNTFNFEAQLDDQNPMFSFLNTQPSQSMALDRSDELNLSQFGPRIEAEIEKYLQVNNY